MLLNALIKEVKYLRREQQHQANHKHSAYTKENLINLNLPAESVIMLNELEQHLKNEQEEYEQALVKKNFILHCNEFH